MASSFLYTAFPTVKILLKTKLYAFYLKYSLIIQSLPCLDECVVGSFLICSLRWHILSCVVILIVTLSCVMATIRPIYKCLFAWLYSPGWPPAGELLLQSTRRWAPKACTTVTRRTLPFQVSTCSLSIAFKILVLSLFIFYPDGFLNSYVISSNFCLFLSTQLLLDVLALYFFFFLAEVQIFGNCSAELDKVCHRVLPDKQKLKWWVNKIKKGEMIPIFLAVLFLRRSPNPSSPWCEWQDRWSIVNAQIHNIPREKQEQTTTQKSSLFTLQFLMLKLRGPCGPHRVTAGKVTGASSNNYRPMFFLLQGSHCWETTVLIRKWAVLLKEQALKRARSR